MSLSKLESLPNELLINILQKYVNGVDLLVAFLGQLNSRFDALIAACRRFRFDFREVRKDDFLICMSSLSSNNDKIQALILSEWHTPGLVNIFLASFPSFNQFSQLRVLHFHFDTDTADCNQLNIAFDSLKSTSIHTLAIIFKSGSRLWKTIEPQNVFKLAFHIHTLKRLSFDSGYLAFDRYTLSHSCTNVEYLNLQNTSIYWTCLQSILSRARHLKYLNVRLNDNASSPRRIFLLRMNLYYRMVALRTFIIHFSDPYATAFHLLMQCFHVMPNLTHLEVISDTKRITAEAWEKAIESYLPRLIYFLLIISSFDFSENQISDILGSFQTSFWTAKTNFNVLITTAITEYQFQRLFDKSLGKKQAPPGRRDSWVTDPSIIQWRSAPLRSPASDTLIMNNKITNLNLSGHPILPSHECHFNNVTTLNVSDLNASLIDWVTAHINLLRITDLKIWNYGFDCDIIPLLLMHTENINSLRICLKKLMSLPTTTISKCNGLKRLDLSDDEHTFSEEDISAIARLFPHIEHLEINTVSLHNIPLLNVHFSRLRSVIFKVIDSFFSRFDTNEVQQWENEMRQTAQFLFNRTSDWITVWIDKNALTDGYWQTFDQKLQSTDSPNNSETPQKKHKPSADESAERQDLS